MQMAQIPSKYVLHVLNIQSSDYTSSLLASSTGSRGVFFMQTANRVNLYNARIMISSKRPKRDEKISGATISPSTGPL